MISGGRLAVAAVTALVLSTGAWAQDGEQPAGDHAAGEQVFKKCAQCHKVGPDARNGVGPVLNGIIGRPAGTYPDYRYSKANLESGVVWDEDTLLEYLRAPRQFIPGTKMPFGGLKDDGDIVDLIAYLARFGPDGEPASAETGAAE